MKQSVIKEMATNELEEHLTDQKVRLEKMKINHTVSPLENPKQITFARKTIARILTELRNREKNIKQINQEKNEKPKKRKNWNCNKQ